MVDLALTGSVIWLDHHPVHQRVVGSIPSQGPYLRCGFHLWLGAYRKQPKDFSHIDVLLSVCLSVCVSQINKNLSLIED